MYAETGLMFPYFDNFSPELHPFDEFCCSQKPNASSVNIFSPLVIFICISSLIKIRLRFCLGLIIIFHLFKLGFAVRFLKVRFLYLYLWASTFIFLNVWLLKNFGRRFDGHFQEILLNFDFEIWVPISSLKKKNTVIPIW